MPFKTCQKCGEKSPPFFSHCLHCGTLFTEERKEATRVVEYIAIIVILVSLVVLTIFVLVPLIQYIMVSVNHFSLISQPKSGTESQKTGEYGINQPAGDGNLIITVTSARDGENTYNANKFFLVSITLQNVRTDRTLVISNSDFELTDSNGITYYPYGIGSRITHELSPLQTGYSEIVFIIPQKTNGEKMRFNFPRLSDQYSTVNSGVVFLLQRTSRG